MHASQVHAPLHDLKRRTDPARPLQEFGVGMAWPPLEATKPREHCAGHQELPVGRVAAMAVRPQSRAIREQRCVRLQRFIDKGRPGSNDHRPKLLIQQPGLFGEISGKHDIVGIEASDNIRPGYAGERIIDDVGADMLWKIAKGDPR